MSEPSSDADALAFPGVIGHRSLTTMVSRAIVRARLHHGLVLTGPRGIGKAAFARGLACALMCPRAPGRGCGSCDTCRRLLEGNHTDLRLLEGEGKSNTVKVDAARQVALAAQHAPFEAPAHVIVIDPADRMQPAAAAALLKSIEEPNPGVYWVLLATNKSDVLDTILSRCMTMALERLSLADTRAVVLDALERRPPPPELGVDHERRELAISLSDGSPGVALELLADPSLEPTRELLRATLEAIAAGPSAVFSGDRSPLWSAWKGAIAAVPDPDAEPVEEAPERVVVVKGKKPKAQKRGRKKSAKKTGSKETPARQRATALRLAELWLLHLRERLLGRPGLGGMPELRAGSAGELGHHMQAIQTFQTNLARNPNVRLSFEQLLLSLGS